MSGVEALIGGWFASAAVARVVAISESYLGANYQLQRDTKRLIENLTQRLSLVQGTVNMADKLMNNNPDLVNWLGLLKEAVYDAEDVLDNLAVQSSRKERAKNKSKVSHIVSSSIAGLKNLVFPDKDYKKLEETVKKLEQLSAQNNNFLIMLREQNDRSNICQVVERRETISEPINLEADLYGRENELSLILNLILDLDLKSSSKILQQCPESSEQEKKKSSDYRGLIVLPIVGMGGIGKTTLAKAVYNNPATTQIFKKKEWIYVSYEFSVALVLRKIIRSLEPNHQLEKMTVQDLTSLFSTIKAGVRFLIVLNNMFEYDENQWDILYTSLSRNVPGSVVLLTSQNQELANKVGTFGFLALNPLEGSVFWKLFERFSFGDVEVLQENRETLESIGKEIAKRLGGLPLAAKVIGNLLKSDLSIDHWKEIAESKWWQIPEGRSQILSSIGLVYQFLDPSLRQCFAYSSLFPKNSLLEKDRMVQMWIAQNFIRPDGTDRRLEDIGEQWFNKLVKFSFFESECDAELNPIPFDPNTSNKSCCYVMHDFMHDLAVIASSGDCFYLGDNSPKIPPTVRHIAVDTKEPNKIRAIRNCIHLRSLIYCGTFQVDEVYNAINDTLSKLNSIRVLDLSHLNMGKELKVLEAIRKLRHLRFLDLSCTIIEDLKCSSLNHYHLQALHIKDCIFRRSPNGIYKLINLRHLCANVETVALISHIGQLTNLQQLEMYPVGKEVGHKITELENLSEIRGPLRILNCENIVSKDEAMCAKLNEKKNLSVVEISWSSEPSDSDRVIDILEELRPHNNIKDLTLSNYMGLSLPNWMMQMNDFPILQNVHIFSCKQIEFLPPFGHLPCLKFLHLEGLSSVKQLCYHFYGENKTIYPSLKYLIFSSLSSCEVWTEAPKAEFFPRLSALTITGSKGLEKAPLHRFGASLRSLKLGECHKLSMGTAFQHLTSLTHLSICNSEASIYLDFHYLRLLELLSLEDCPKLNIEENLLSLTNLKRLEITRCPELFVNYDTDSQQKGKGLGEHQRDGLRSLIRLNADNSLWDHDYPKILGDLPTLRILDLKQFQMNLFTISQTSWLRKLTTLEELNFYNCDFEHLPNFDNLFSLKKVMLISCTRLESLRRMPLFLRELTIRDCTSSLEQRCKKQDGIEGEDWHHISHVPCIQLNKVIAYNFQDSGGISGLESFPILCKHSDD